MAAINKPTNAISVSESKSRTKRSDSELGANSGIGIFFNFQASREGADYAIKYRSRFAIQNEEGQEVLNSERDISAAFNSPLLHSLQPSRVLLAFFIGAAAGIGIWCAKLALKSLPTIEVPAFDKETIKKFGKAVTTTCLAVLAMSLILFSLRPMFSWVRESAARFKRAPELKKRLKRQRKLRRWLKRNDPWGGG